MMSEKGGASKTCIAVNLIYFLRKYNLRVLLKKEI